MEKKVKKRLSIIKKDNRKYILNSWNQRARPRTNGRRKKVQLQGNSSIYAMAERTAKQMLRTGTNVSPIKYKDPVKQQMFISFLKRSLQTYISRV